MITYSGKPREALDLDATSIVSAPLTFYFCICKDKRQFTASVVFKDTFKDILMTFKQKLDLDWYEKLTDDELMTVSKSMNTFLKLWKV